LLCNFRTGTRLRLGNFAPRESTVELYRDSLPGLLSS